MILGMGQENHCITYGRSLNGYEFVVLTRGMMLSATGITTFQVCMQYNYLSCIKMSRVMIKRRKGSYPRTVLTPSFCAGVNESGKATSQFTIKSPFVFTAPSFLIGIPSPLILV